ncbi:hypothetical protein BKA69DRAFT_1127287 [Paraphysoderma sedebokerense]|nr:hypothetical protein BKA69DRAFT_1127287 [Paraphysoderma sedebokerense]
MATETTTNTIKSIWIACNTLPRDKTKAFHCSVSISVNFQDTITSMVASLIRGRPWQLNEEEKQTLRRKRYVLFLPESKTGVLKNTYVLQNCLDAVSSSDHPFVLSEILNQEDLATIAKNGITLPYELNILKYRLTAAQQAALISVQSIVDDKCEIQSSAVAKHLCDFLFHAISALDGSGYILKENGHANFPGNKEMGYWYELIINTAEDASHPLIEKLKKCYEELITFLIIKECIDVDNARKTIYRCTEVHQLFNVLKHYQFIPVSIQQRGQDGKYVGIINGVSGDIEKDILNPFYAIVKAWVEACIDVVNNVKIRRIL